MSVPASNVDAPPIIIEDLGPFRIELYRDVHAHDLRWRAIHANGERITDWSQMPAAQDFVQLAADALAWRSGFPGARA